MQRNTMPKLACLAAFLLSGPWLAALAAPGAVPMPAFELPPSNYTSAEARAALQHSLDHPDPAFGTDIAAARAFYGRFNDERLAEMRRRYVVEVRREQLGGVTVDRVIPGSGIAPSNRRRILINVHGGAFLWGSGSGALVEAIPIAATGGIEVAAVDYRLAPEHRFPAASEDVAAVYRSLLKTHPAKNIGIYGCSAGGIITAQAIAWFDAQALPMPGAIGTFCGTGSPYGGDSAVLSSAFNGRAPATTAATDTLSTVYMSGVEPTNGLGYPLTSPTVLAKFPPTLHLAGSRDFAASALTLSHRKLLARGVDSQLVLFDGLGHAFFMRPDLPESREAYAIVWQFFDGKLGRR